MPVPVPQSPRANGAYRIKRRSRPAVNSTLENRDPDDIAIPTIETPITMEPIRPLFQQRATEPAEGYLAPLAGRRFMTLPRTPVAQQNSLANGWECSTQRDLGESIIRPMSTCSLLSNSSDDSNGSLTSYPAGDGSCTSPESDAPDPFKFATIRKSKAKQWATLARNDEAIQEGLSSKQVQVHWTPEMDKHLWTIYLVYLQDPTVTPFKMLPGIAPPLGVCHRVAREARRSWRGGKVESRKPSELLCPPTLGTDVDRARPKAFSKADSPDTIREDRSGSNTPTSAKVRTVPLWPKSGSSTRRRLRHLCKCKPTIAPHYQRLLQSRSPSPFSSSSRTPSRSQSRLSEVSGPFEERSSSFNTRDIQLSLTTSTAATMQLNGPLAQLASGTAAITRPTNEWFNEPPVPWASPTAIPSDVNAGVSEQEDLMQTPQLGSPFGYHTWGPSRSRQRIRPSTSRIQSSDASTLGPSLRSPVRLHDTFPYPGVHKRRARHQLEDELSPGGSNMQQTLHDNLLSSPPAGRHRRVRSRGFSLGDVNAPNPLESLFTPPSSHDQMTPTEPAAGLSSSDQLEPPTPTQIRRLGSPFHGIAARASPGRSRHTATMSLGSYGPNAFSSIGETLGQANHDDIVRARLQTPESSVLAPGAQL